MSASGSLPALDEVPVHDPTAAAEVLRPHMTVEVVDHVKYGFGNL